MIYQFSFFSFLVDTLFKIGFVIFLMNFKKKFENGFPKSTSTEEVREQAKTFVLATAKAIGKDQCFNI